MDEKATIEIVGILHDAPMGEKRVRVIVSEIATRHRSTVEIDADKATSTEDIHAAVCAGCSLTPEKVRWKIITA